MRFTSYATASALAALATAQTWTECNPMEKECPNDPAMPASFDTDFKAGKDAVKGWKQTAGSLTYAAGGAEFTVAKKGDAPTIQSEGFLHFGYVEVKMTAAPGQGIISSIVLQSQNLDEVDWEWIGGQEGRVQMNYFGKGNTTTYDRMIEAPVATTQTETHTYALDWKPESLTWIIDGKPVRTLNYADANGGKNYPQTPCNVRIGNWPGGDSENEGTRQWAGGEVDYAQAPFTMTVDSIKVKNYSPGKEYKWTDKTGSKDSIEVIGAGDKDGAPQNTAVIEPSATASSKPIASGIDAPDSEGDKDESPANDSTTCTTGGSIMTTAAPVGGGFNYPTGSPKPSGGVAGSPPSENGDSEDDEDCECGTATVTVTGPPPAATFSAEYPAIPPESITTKIPIVSSVQVPIVSSAAPVQPPASQPPYPTTGLVIETRPPPAPPAPSAPSGALPPTPSRNATVSAPPQFTGAASQNKAGMMVGAVAGVVLLAF